ncbi:hypothetical protein [Deinococcus sp. Marseille-Q6407]|uniref:hypothetical protein n=1 Tax=Deinococcus sp. Marseille-Q6407 TaxID=2969223 RepID=UPI0021BF08E0|nr:hypothetical protein [Deinococcus sp. Marseille-Q6407]
MVHISSNPQEQYLLVTHPNGLSVQLDTAEAKTLLRALLYREAFTLGDVLQLNENTLLFAGYEHPLNTAERARLSIDVQRSLEELP